MQIPMRNFLFSLLVLLSLLSFAFAAFNLSIYLYPSENETQVVFSNFTISDASYSIILSGQKPIFLLKNGEPLGNLNGISSVLGAYYKSTSYPASADLALLKNYTLTYNFSRNDGGRYPEKEEAICKQILLLNGIKYGTGYIYCDSDEGCLKIAEVFYSATYTKGVKKTISFDDTLKLLKDFANSTNGNDNAITRMAYLLDHVNDTNLESSLKEIKSLIVDLRKYKAVIENTEFRTPTTEQGEVQRCIDDKCFALCPDLSFNKTALDSLDNGVSSLLSKSQPYISYKTISKIIFDSTNNRLLYRTDETKATKFSELFEPLALRADDTLQRADGAIAYLSNDSLIVRANSVRDLTEKINKSIQHRNFSTIEDDLQNYEQTMNEIDELIPAVLETYNKTLSFKQSADSTVFILDTKDLGSSDKRKLADLKNLLYAVDSSFSRGLNDEQTAELLSTYKNISQQASLLLKNYRGDIITTATSKFRAFARRVNSGLANLASTTNVVKPADFISNKLLYFGGFALITFLSLSSLAFLIFTKIYRSTSPASGKFVKFGIVATYILLVLGLLIFSAMLYIFLDKTALSADIEEFVYDFAQKNSSVIAIDVQGAPYGAIATMHSCANQLATNLESDNKSVTVYEFDSVSCTVKTSDGELISRSKNQCAAEVKNSTSFIMRFSSVPEKPALTTTYDTKAYVSGDESYYKFCTFSDLFK